MAIREFLSTRQVFTVEDFAARFPGSQTDRNLLSRAVKRGGVDRVRRGLYVSKTGRFEGTTADPLDVALALAPDAVFCYTSALDLLGVAHNLTNRVQFFTTKPTASFTYDRVRYLPRSAAGTRPPPLGLLSPTGRSYRVTTEEQTLIDCLTNMAAAAGPDHLLHSLSGMAALEPDLAAETAATAPASVRARLGWILEVKRDDWEVADQTLADLEASLGSGPSYFWSSSTPRDRFWVKRWKLYLPRPEQEMASWLTL